MPKKITLRETPVGDLEFDSRNANRGNERGAAMLKDSLERYGAGRSILLDRNGRVIAGNKTLENAKALGFENVVIVPSDGKQLIAVQRTDVDLDSKAGRELAIADNRIAEANLEWDAEQIRALMPEIDVSQFWTELEWDAEQIRALMPEIDVSQFWTEAELAAVLGEAENTLLGDEDDVPDAPAVPVTKLGDLYALGDHRLLCGDSTDAAQVARLMGRGKASCMWTDPPYGVDYEGKTARALRIQGDSKDGLRALLDAAFRNAAEALEPGGRVYVSHPPGAINVTFGNAFLDAGWRLHQTLIWDKGTMVLGHSDYHFAHEPIFYGFTPGAKGRVGRGGSGWYGDDSERSILPFPKPSRSAEHPTMKPVALIEHCLGNSTAPGDAVLDLFAGSGSTLIACEKTRRICYAMELSPAYCDVIVNRWQTATGRKAELLQ